MMKRSTQPVARPRGRPSKFGRPSRVVAVTLPQDAIERLHRVHRDLGWAIMTLLDNEEAGPRPVRTERILAEPDVELVTIGDRRALIVVNREIIRHLPGVNIIPFRGNRAFVALDIDRGMSDLELAVTDRLADASLEPREARALGDLRAHLTSWRRDHDLKILRRAIIVVERRAKTGAARPLPGVPKTGERQRT
jgi:hypothetical protein